MKGYKQLFDDKMNDVPSVQLAGLNHFPAHWHIQCEIVFVVDGSLDVGINNFKKTLTKGGIAISSSNFVHYYQEGQGNQLMCIFHPAMLGCNIWQKDVELQNPIIESDDIPFEIKQKCYDLVNNFHSNANLLIKKGNILTLCGLIEDLLPTNPKPTNIPYADILSAIEFIEKNFKNDIDLSTISHFCNVSKYHFSRKFGAYTGMNLNEYINTLRIEFSEEQLLTTDDSITEIAYKSGFESLRTFNRVFRQIKGKTPTDVKSGLNSFK